MNDETEKNSWHEVLANHLLLMDGNDDDDDGTKRNKHNRY